VAQLRLTINESNLAEHLSQLKYLSINSKALNEFVGLARPLAQLAIDTQCTIGQT